jgi:hypothetical protein
MEEISDFGSRWELLLTLAPKSPTERMVVEKCTQDVKGFESRDREIG